MAAAGHAEPRHGPLPALLLLLTVVAGVMDATSFLGLGHVFVANVTGNIVFLGFALAGAPDLPTYAALAAVAAFLTGTLLGGRIARRYGAHRGRFLAVAVAIKMVPVMAALIVAAMGGQSAGWEARYALIVLLAAAMGLQTATARKLRVSGLTTTVLTSTLTDMAADERWTTSDGRLPSAGAMEIVSMVGGAALGGLLVLRVGIAAALGLSAVLLLLTGLAASWLSRGPAPWAQPP